MDESRWIVCVELESLSRRRDVSFREKALRRLLYETAARTTELLLEVEDFDVANKRATVAVKVGDTDVINVQVESARLHLGRAP